MVTTMGFLQYYLKSSTKRGWEMSSLLVAIQPKSLLYANYINVDRVWVAKPRNAGITAKPQFGNFPLWLGW